MVGGFRPIILETLIMRYGLKGKGRTRPDFFRVVLGPCAQFYPCETSEQKWAKHQNRMKNDRVMPINVQAQKWYMACFGP